MTGGVFFIWSESGGGLQFEDTAIAFHDPLRTSRCRMSFDKQSHHKQRADATASQIDKSWRCRGAPEGWADFPGSMAVRRDLERDVALLWFLVVWSSGRKPSKSSGLVHVSPRAPAWRRRSVSSKEHRRPVQLPRNIWRGDRLLKTGCKSARGTLGVKRGPILETFPFPGLSACSA